MRQLSALSAAQIRTTLRPLFANQALVALLVFNVITPVLLMGILAVLNSFMDPFNFSWWQAIPGWAAIFVMLSLNIFGALQYPKWWLAFTAMFLGNFATIFLIGELSVFTALLRAPFYGGLWLDAYLGW